MSADNEQQVGRMPLPNQRGFVSPEEIERIRAERKNKPSNIAHRLLETLVQIEAPGTRFDLMQDNIAASIQRCRETGTPFMVDTITCPLYQFGEGLGAFENFSLVSGVGENLQEEPRYLAKFQRYLAALSVTNRFFQQLEPPIQVAGRVYFGDSGILGLDVIKRQFGAKTDREAKDVLARTNEAYKRYFEQQKERLGLQDVVLEFVSITDISPELASRPMDLYELGRTLGVIDISSSGASLQEKKLREIGVDPTIVEGVREIADHHADRRRKELMGRRKRENDIVPRTFLEVIGFLVSYGFAGKALVRQPVRTDLFVTGDPANSYRNYLYYAFLGKKGIDLAVFTPSSERVQQQGIF